ncbi:hypothetical protein [Streptomyces sp. CA-132043]|uniref:hypothetical protein n=1 Tax=Streptomyces sp. CA-132043 TaxID=3240048 RepID=UPI003D8C8674
MDATLVACHSKKEHAAPTYKHGFGYHPLLCFLDNTGEALAGLVRPGNAPDQHRRGPHHRARRRAHPAPRSPPPRHRHPHPRGQRRIRQSVPGPHPRPALARDPHLLLRRMVHHRTGPPSDTPAARPGLAPCSRTGRRPAARRPGRRAHRSGRPTRPCPKTPGSSSAASARIPAPSCPCRRRWRWLATRLGPRLPTPAGRLRRGHGASRSADQ